MLAFWIPFLVLAFALGWGFGRWKGAEAKGWQLVFLLVLPLLWYAVVGSFAALQGAEIWREFWGYFWWGLEMVLAVAVFWAVVVWAGLWLGRRART